MPKLTTLLVFLIALIAMGAIIRKAGYSKWWLLIALAPGLNYIMLFVFAFSDWPVLREVRFRKATAETVDPKDGRRFLGDALKCELRGDVAEALWRYGRIAELFSGQSTAEDARISLASLQEKQGIRHSASG